LIPQDRNTNEGAGDIVITECPRHDLPGGGKVFTTIARDVDRGLHNVDKRCSCSIESCREIADGLLRLTYDVIDSDSQPVLVEGARSGREDES
jgi:hypothetical protein